MNQLSMLSNNTQKSSELVNLSRRMWLPPTTSLPVFTPITQSHFCPRCGYAHQPAPDRQTLAIQWVGALALSTLIFLSIAMARLKFFGH